MKLDIGSELIGLVDAKGIAGYHIDPDGRWCPVLHLAAFRVGDEVSRVDLRCAITTEGHPATAGTAAVRPYVQVQARVEGFAEDGLVRLALLGAVTDGDGELCRIGQQLRAPVVLQVPFSGELRLNRAVGEFTGPARWGGRTVRLSLGCAEPHRPEAVVAAAKVLFDAQPDWHRQVEAIAARRLLADRDAGEPGAAGGRPSAADLGARMLLEEIHVAECGDVTFWHDDGQLFGGQVIQVSGTLATGPTVAELTS